MLTLAAVGHHRQVMSSVGYGDTIPKTDGGRAFTAILAIPSVML
jgi:hypothetical protein